MHLQWATLVLVTIIVLPSANTLARGKSSCKGVECSGHGICKLVRGQPKCACASGFVSDKSGLNCRKAARRPRSGSGKRIRVVTTPSGMDVALDGRGGWHETPTTFRATPGQHWITVKGSGYAKETIPIPVGGRNLTLKVKMNRALREGGIVLVTFGVASLIASLGMIASEADCDGCWAPVGAPLLAVGAALVAPGAWMIHEDRDREPIYTLRGSSKLKKSRKRGRSDK